MSRSDRGDRERWHGEAVTDEGTMIERFRSSQGDFAACGRRVTLPTAARRRKVHSTPFPPNGENCVRSLAPPLPGEPVSLGFAGSNEGLDKTPPGTAQDGHWRAHIRLTPDPVLRESLLRSSAKFPARGNLSDNLNSFRATGPWVCKIAAAAVPHLRLTLPNERRPVR